MLRGMPHWLLRVLIPLFRRASPLFGRGFVLLEHRCRRTGHNHHVLLEVVHREPGALMVISGYGPTAQWYRNITADPRVRIWSGGIRHAPALATPLSAEHGTAILESYRHHHPLAARVLGRAFGIPEFAQGRPVPLCRAEELPLVRIGTARRRGRVN
ncbi:MAG TPA: nitroreductase family deazaflavin-dependent oxidoreductase [Pseudonocardiaceae bacterium]